MPMRKTLAPVMMMPQALLQQQYLQEAEAMYPYPSLAANSQEVWLQEAGAMYPHPSLATNSQEAGAMYPHPSLAANSQSDSHSELVLEDLISNIAPCWLSKTDSQGELFQIFMKALSEVAEHRRLTIMVFLLRTLGEKCSLGVLVVHLFRQLILRIKECSSERGLKLPSCSTFTREWEYVFASQLYSQYASKIWFPSLVIILEEIEIHRENEEASLQLYLAMQFILQKLQDTELVFELESGQIADYL